MKNKPMKLLYRFRIATSSGSRFPVKLLATQECWPATSDDAAQIESLLTGDTPATHRVPIELRSRQIFHARAWQNAGWEIVYPPTVL